MCYLGSLTQYHTENSNIDEENAGPAWIISLGHFASAVWHPRTMSDAALFPPGSNVPFVEHTLDDGNVCVLTGENGVGVSGAEATKKAQAKGQVGDTVSRSTSLRFACSPDARRHIVVTEPAQCAYVVEMYLPELCIEPGMAVMLPGGIEFKGVKEEMTVGERSSYDGDLDEEEDEYLDPDDEGDPPQRNGGKGTKDDSEKDEL